VVHVPVFAVLCVLVAFMLTMLYAGVLIVPLVLAVGAVLRVALSVRVSLVGVCMLRAWVGCVVVLTMGGAFLAVSPMVHVAMDHGLVVRAVVGAVHGTMIVPPGGLARYQAHAADGTGARLASDDLRVHGADILGLSADHVHVEVGRLWGEGTLREELPQFVDAGSDVLLPRSGRSVWLGEWRDVRGADREDGTGPGHLGVRNRGGLFEPRWQLAY
jgi:hypothetical protein